MARGPNPVSFLVTTATARLPFSLKLVHGFGAVAFGVKDNGFSVFLLIYYNQVLGMEAGLVSLALALALIIDAVVDPLLGNLSDRTYTRWGRRLPWLYAAPLPLAIAWTVLWSPPLGDAPSFIGLLAIAVVVRLLLSACEVPSTALVPELTSDYDERTTLFRYRYLFGWIGGLTMMLLAYIVFLPDEEMLSVDGYRAFGIAGAALIALSTLLSALGQHRRVARWPAVKPPPFTFARAFTEIREAFSQTPFLILSAGSVAAFISQGTTFAMTNYLALFVWEFGATPLSVFGQEISAFVGYVLILFGSIIVVFFTLGPLHRQFGKAKTARAAAIIALITWSAPYALRLAGLWPDIGTMPSTLLFFAFVFVSNVPAVMVMISASSMVADIVEAFEEKTGRRAEGSFYSGFWFVQKCATGLGIFLAGLIVTAAGMPDNAQPGDVGIAVLDALTIYYIAAMIVLGIVSAFWFGRFPIDRASHNARIAALEASKAQLEPPRRFPR